MRRVISLMAAAALVVSACGSDSTVGAPASRDATDQGRGGSIVELDVTVEDVDDTALEIPAGEDPEYVELAATGPVAGEFSTFPRCDAREDDEGAYLHVFFAYFDDARPEIPTVDVVMRLRPIDVSGAITLEDDDLEVEYRHADLSNQELLKADLAGTVERSATVEDLPLVILTFDGSYQGEVGEGTFTGELSCIVPEAPSADAAGSSVIDASGGRIVSGDGAVELAVPAGAVDEPHLVSIEPLDHRDGVVAAWDLSPDGLVFASPAAITVRYPGDLPPDVTPESLVLVHVTSQGETVLEEVARDAGARTITGRISHFSQIELRHSAPGDASLVGHATIRVRESSLGYQDVTAIVRFDRRSAAWTLEVRLELYQSTPYYEFFAGGTSDVRASTSGTTAGTIELGGMCRFGQDAVTTTPYEGVDVGFWLASAPPNDVKVGSEVTVVVNRDNEVVWAVQQDDYYACAILTEAHELRMTLKEETEFDFELEPIGP